MVDKVYQRGSETLRKQVEELKIEIEVRRRKDVVDIVETDFFRDLQSKGERCANVRFRRGRMASSRPPAARRRRASSCRTSVVTFRSPSSATSQRRIETSNRSPAPANGAPPLATQEAYHADRTLLWAGDPKLVIVSYPTLHANYLFELLGYARTSHAAPQNPSDCLGRDILDDEALLRRLIAHAGPTRCSSLCPML